jgi:hypothetical protein
MGVEQIWVLFNSNGANKDKVVNNPSKGGARRMGESFIFNQRKRNDLWPMTKPPN